ncbi:hypothetical protein, partial [Acinetobacter baumannii]|uniref:hypothetical protein n=1 Tax=Acinetobacter baumannii TaxID=470 RepID=UPI001BB46ABB
QTHFAIFGSIILSTVYLASPFDKAFRECDAGLPTDWIAFRVLDGIGNCYDRKLLIGCDEIL